MSVKDSISEISEEDQEWGWMVLQRFGFDQVYGRDEVQMFMIICLDV